MGKKEYAQQGSNPYLNTSQIQAVKNFLKSPEGKEAIKEVSSRVTETDKAINEMVIVNQDQLHQPFTI